MSDCEQAAARAKINLYLHITGRRGDGYHLLDSLIVFAALGDTVEVRGGDDLSLEVEGPFDFAALGDTVEVRGGDDLSLEVEGPFAAAVPQGGENLVLRAAEALADAAGVKARARIRLIKRLPAASGIGGGSADAAATLQALARLWNVRPLQEDLERIALGLGADVPVCLRGAPSFVGGIGDKIVPSPVLPDTWMVLANPGIAVATADVFRRRGGAFSSPARFHAAPADAHALGALLAERRNDLTDAAVSLAPVIAESLAHLSCLPSALLARMSGSGATGFALFADAAAAEAAAAELRAAQPSWWVAATAMDVPTTVAPSEPS